jgi:hypothetical protein
MQSQSSPARSSGMFRDHYQEALQHPIEAKMKGLAIKPRAASTPTPVIDLVAALKRSLAEEAPTPRNGPLRAERNEPSGSRSAPGGVAADAIRQAKKTGKVAFEPGTIVGKRRRKS